MVRAKHPDEARRDEIFGGAVHLALLFRQISRHLPAYRSRWRPDVHKVQHGATSPCLRYCLMQRR